jgi:dihydroorotate dehydrogenase
MNKNITIVGVGGVDNHQKFNSMIGAGASLVQVYSAFIYKGPSISKTILN